MKLGISGSHSTGKSTLAKKLAKELSLPIVTESARSFEIHKVSSIEKYSEIQIKILQKQIQEELKYDKFVTDRTVIDNLAYWMSICSNSASDSDNEYYICTVLNHLSNYDKFIYVPINLPVVDDGFRFISKPFQENIDDIIRTLLILYTDFIKVDVRDENIIKNIKKNLF